MTAVRQIAYRLKSEGKTELLRDQREVGQGFKSSFQAGVEGAVAATAATAKAEKELQKLAATQAAQAEQVRRLNAISRAGAADYAGASVRPRDAVLAQAAAQSSRGELTRGRFDAILGVGATSGQSARESAAFFAAEAAEMERVEARARALKAVLDPLSVAQDHLNDELREYDALAKAGRISTAELAQAQTLARVKYDQTAAAIGRQERGLTKLVVASRLNLARQGADVFTTAAMGMNPAMIAIQQGPQILDAMATSGFKASAGLLLVGGALTAVAAGTAVMVAAWMSGESSALKYERAVTGIGRTARLTAGELRSAAIAGAEAGEISIRAAQDQAAAYVATGRIGGEIITGLIAIGKDYASVFGLEAEEATKSLAKAMTEPDKAARELTRTMGLLDQRTLDQIDSLMKSGDQLKAQKILLEAIAGSVEGHSEKVSGITSAWDAAKRAMSNYWTGLGESLYTTREEQLEKYDATIANANRTNANPQRIAQLEAERAAIAFEIGYDRAKAENDARSASGNQAAQLAKDRHDAGASDRNKAQREAERAAREAEREARETLQRERRDEDQRAAREMQIAQATGDEALVRSLGEEERIRTRIRQLVDDGTAKDKARTQALEEDAPLREALADAAGRERDALKEAARIEALQVGGMEQSLSVAERELDVRRRTEAYRRAGLGVITETVEGSLDLLMIDQALTQASRDRLALDQARQKVIEQSVREAEAEHRLRLAQLSGDTRTETWLSIEDRIQRRAREIERTKNMDRGQGVDQAQSEIQAELDAEATGARRAWLDGFLSDIQRGRISEALSEQFQSAVDRLRERLIDAIFSQDWSSLFGGGKGGGKSNFLMDLASAVFKPGKNAAGTDHWEGGLTWVGERGPELLNLPRGSQVIEHNRSMQTAATAAQGGGGAQSFVFAPVIHAEGAGPREVDALRAELGGMEQRIRRDLPGMMRDARARRQV